GDLDVAPGGAALLREAGRILGHDALALEVRSHAEQLADGDDTRAADARHDDAPGRVGHRQRRLRNGRQRVGARTSLVLFRRLELPAFHRHEARAEAVDAGVVLVAGVLVDAALAAELGLDRLHRQAVALGRA